MGCWWATFKYYFFASKTRRCGRFLHALSCKNCINPLQMKLLFNIWWPLIPILLCECVGLCMCVYGFLCGVLFGLHSGRKFTMEDVWSSFHSGAGKVVKYVQAIKDSSMFHLNRANNRRVSMYPYLLKKKEKKTYLLGFVVKTTGNILHSGRMEKDKQSGWVFYSWLLHSSPEGMQSIKAINYRSCPTTILPIYWAVYYCLCNYLTALK